MEFLDSSPLRVCIADRARCTPCPPPAWFQTYTVTGANSAVLNTLSKLHVSTAHTDILRKIQSASRCGEVGEGKIVQDAEAVTE